MNKLKIHDRLVTWYKSHARDLPWRKLWRKHADPWHIWVSEIMLQQTVIKAVLPVYEPFLKQYPSPVHLADATTEDVRLAVRGLGYYRRFDFLHKASRLIRDEFCGAWPDSYEAWKKIPGIGDYTASAISSITLNLPHGVVDGNVERVLCRLLDIRTPPNLPELKARFKLIMDDLAGFGEPGILNQSVMELGQTTCTPTSPKCETCPISSECLSFERGSQHLAPAAKIRPDFRSLEFVIAIPKYRDKYYLVRRSTLSRFLKGTLGFPTFIKSVDGTLSADGFESPEWLKAQVLEAKPHKHRIKHSITQNKISASIVLIEAFETDIFEVGRNAHELEAVLVSNLDRKALKALEQESPKITKATRAATKALAYSQDLLL